MMFWKRRIYADAAAATPLSSRAKRELLRLLGVYGNAGALHSEAQQAKKELEKARASIAHSIGAHPDEIVFTASGTEANNLAIGGVLRPLLRQDDDVHAITLSIEHQSILEPLYALQRDGLEVSEVGVQPDGTVFPNTLVESIKPTTRFVSVQLVNSEIGTIVPLKEIAKGVRRAKQKIYLHTDASQAPLWQEINVEKLGVDLMTLDGQKILGPKGIGVLYIKRGTPIEPILWGGSQESGVRGGTENIPHIGAFAVALADAQKGVARRVQKVSDVRDYLWSEIKKAIPDAIWHGPQKEERVANNINISIPGLDGEMAVVSMDTLGVALSTRSACSTGNEEPSHVITALGVEKSIAKSAIRITLLPGATRGEARRIVAALTETIGRYRIRA